MWYMWNVGTQCILPSRLVVSHGRPVYERLLTVVGKTFLFVRKHCSYLVDESWFLNDISVLRSLIGVSIRNWSRSLLVPRFIIAGTLSDNVYITKSRARSIPSVAVELCLVRGSLNTVGDLTSIHTLSILWWPMLGPWIISVSINAWFLDRLLFPDHLGFSINAWLLDPFICWPAYA